MESDMVVERFERLRGGTVVQRASRMRSESVA
jgi:hypothetical protein